MRFLPEPPAPPAGQPEGYFFPSLATGALVALVEHDGEQIVPQGGTVLHEEDHALVIIQAGQENAVRSALGSNM